MQKFTYMFMLVLLIAVTGVSAQSADVFTIFGEEAVVSRGREQYTDPGAAFYHEEQFHMFYNAFSGWPSHVEIKYATSPDGRAWTTENDDLPIITDDMIDYDGLTLLASSVLVEEDGTWVLYFYTWQDRSGGAPSEVGRATAPAAIGPWTFEPAPVLMLGSPGEWDDQQVTSPTVEKTAEGYVMYYTGRSRENIAQVGMATSPDGITWTKYDDPATTDAPYAESDPIIPTTEGWLAQPRLEITEDGYVLLLKSMTLDANGRPTVPGGTVTYATSPDGLTWTLSEAIAVSPEAVSQGRAIWFTELVHVEDSYYLFYELGKGSNTEVYLATYDGMLP